MEGEGIPTWLPFLIVGATLFAGVGCASYLLTELFDRIDRKALGKTPDASTGVERHGK